MRKIDTLHISHKAANAYHEVVQKNTACEIAGAFAVDSTEDGARAKVVDFQEYSQAKKNSDSVSFTDNDINESDKSFMEDGHRHAGITHSHLENLGHANDWSSQDMATIDNHKNDERTDFHVLGYRKEGETILKAVNRYGKEISLLLDDGQNGEEASVGKAA